MFAQEPWCRFPAEWRKLTDWQIEHLFARPAAERAQRFAEEQEARLAGQSRASSQPAEPSVEWTPELIMEKPLHYKNYYFRKLTAFGIPYQRVSEMWDEQYAEFLRMYKKE